MLTGHQGLGDGGTILKTLGMTKELPLQLMASQVRTMRIHDGPTEVHR